MKLNYVTTTFPNNKKQVVEKELKFVVDDGVENEVINLYPQMKDQVFEGFGGAFTDSAGYVYSLLSETDKKKVIETYFDADKMNYQNGRLHIDSCDFSLEEYQAMGDTDKIEWDKFDISRTQKYMIPFLQDVQKHCGRKIELMITPWSPLRFMKSNKTRVQGGKLLPEYRKDWAEYICKYIIELEKIGCKVNCMTIQNEPKAVQTWDSCIFDAEEEKVFLRDFMYPSLKENGLEHIEVYIWDHNKERVFERALAIIDDETDKMVSGIAFHWYSGDHFEALDLVRKKFPNKKLMLSEACIEYSKFDLGAHLNNAQKYAHDIIGNLNAGMNVFYDWNMILDEEGGPNHVKNFCESPFMFDTNKKELQERNSLSYIWHFSHFIKAGATRIGHTKYTSDLELTAFENPDGTISVIVLNMQKEMKNATIRLNGQMCELSFEGDSITSFVISK